MSEIKSSPEMKLYFKDITDKVSICYKLAAKARAKGFDPEKTVPIPLANNMAERVVGLISVVVPQILNAGIPERIIELENEYGLLDWRVGLKIAVEVAKEKFCKFDTKELAMEGGIRVGFAYLTLGIVSAPLEGFIGLKIKKRRDGKEYFALQYAGPIRAAGGTAASTSVILSDYVRVQMGYSPWDPDEKEILRYITEVRDYNDRVANLQYNPSDEELKFLISKLPVEVDGDPTDKLEVSNHKDLPRIETNLIRGGVALVIAEGLAQKAPKLWKRLSKWGVDFGLDWGWIPEFLKIKEAVHASHGSEKKDPNAKKSISPNNTFIMDIVAGRPVLTHPLAPGGFRLRYGRNRTTGFSAAALHPATLIVLRNFIAIGTQLKLERPGKACTITLCDTLEGPIVRLKSGEVIHLQDEAAAKAIFPQLEEILFLGDILINYGDFSENGHMLVPAGYCPEWWALELKKALETIAIEKCTITKERIDELITNPLFSFPTLKEAVAISSTFDIALHPNHTFYWDFCSADQYNNLITWLKEGKIKLDEKGIQKIILPLHTDFHKETKKVLEFLGTPHQVIATESIILERSAAKIFALTFGFKNQSELSELSIPQITSTETDIINKISPLKIKNKSGTFIGARMGRPEKAKMRKMKGSPQVMFPVGDEGDRLRCFQSAMKVGKITSAFPLFYCEPCQKEMIYTRCEECEGECIKRYFCRFCGDLTKDTCRHGSANIYKTQAIDINYYFEKAVKRSKEKTFPDLIKGIKSTSNKEHLVEHLIKGILRAKHEIYVNKDGTTRYDCTELPLTHFKPKEIKTSPGKLRELGYLKDIHNNPLENEDQLLELKPQDIIIPGFGSLEHSGPKVLRRICNFIDELLIKLYKMKPFYNIEKDEDLVGHLVIGLAPHISAGLVGRIIGFSETQGLITHPMYHAGMRRDCDGDEACVLLLMDGLLNFSRQYLPERRGAKTMDAPLVLTSILNPTEVDDQVHGMDVEWSYPLELYEAALELKNPWEVRYGDNQKIKQLSDRLETELQFEDFGFTHHVDNFNKGVQCSAYKTLPSMREKLIGQMEIAKTVRAVDMDDVARLVIERHFLRDIKGNLRKFSMQRFRCVKCNTKYRRPPLTAKCTECQGKLLFTITEGSVIKYLTPSLELAEKYNFSPYLQQTLDMLKINVDNIFGREKEKQVGLGSFIQ